MSCGSNTSSLRCLRELGRHLSRPWRRGAGRRAGSRRPAAGCGQFEGTLGGFLRSSGRRTDIRCERDDPGPDEGRADALPIEPRKARRMVRTPDAAPAEGGRERPPGPDRNRNPRRPSGVDARKGSHPCRIVRPDSSRPSRAGPNRAPCRPRAAPDAASASTRRSASTRSGGATLRASRSSPRAPA